MILLTCVLFRNKFDITSDINMSHASMLEVNVSISTSYDAPSVVTTIHRREQTIYLQLINKQKERKKLTYLHIYKMENCLDVVGFDL